jgi:hypothetical protein
MKSILIIFLIFSFLFIPILSVRAQEINLNQINFDKLNFDKLPSFSFDSTGEEVSSGEALNFFRDLYTLGKKVKELVSIVWNFASSFLQEVTGLSLGQILVELINVSIGIVGTMIDLLTKVLGN